MMATKEGAVIEELSRRIVPSADIIKYITAGRATFTLRSVQTQKRYTYKVSAMTDGYGKNKKKVPGRFFVALLTGPDNEGSFTNIGRLVNGKYMMVPRCHMPAFKTPSAAFGYTWNYLNSNPSLTDLIEFWHSGRCGHCGKKLTVPESIALGIGPICASK
jgi:hypothetical protein